MVARILKGCVVSNKSVNTLVVLVERRLAHPVYKKVITRSKRYHVHYVDGNYSIGDRISIKEDRPRSALKRWIVCL